MNLEPKQPSVGTADVPILDNQDVDRTYRLEKWQQAIIQIAHHYRLNVSVENVHLVSTWRGVQDDDEMVKMMAKQAGMAVKISTVGTVRLSTWQLPVLLELDDGELAVVKNIAKNDEVMVSYVADDGLVSVLPQAEFNERGRRIIIFRPLENAPDPRIDDYIRPVERHWIWRILFRDLRPYYYVMLGSLVVNLLGLTGIIYSMQTYDRIIPAQSYPTMWVIFSGVVIAFVFDYLLRLLRYGVVDVLGKRADLRISDRVFGHSLRIRHADRPRSTGTFISQIRELEQVREMVTSSTVVAIADLPFFFLFLFIIYMIGGIVFLVPLAGLVLMLLPGLLNQKKLAGLARTAMREANLRSAMLVESIQGLDDIKALQAEHQFQQQWLHYTHTTAASNLQLKHLTHKLTTWSYTVQNSVFVCVILVGTPLAIEGSLSTGALVASSILSSRMMAPISQIASLLTRWQQTKVAIKGLDSIMALPTDHPEHSKKVHKPHLRGDFEFKNCTFKHHRADARPSLSVAGLRIKPGEKVVILGRNGSGKSTLLSALAGMMSTDDGTLTLDQISMAHLDPADIRRDVGYLSQTSRLFHGTIRDNLTLGAPLASDEDILAAFQKTGAENFINRLPLGLDYVIQEGGIGLSGGQLQSLMLSRLLLRDPSIVLLDEPTASLDEVTEQQFVTSMQAWCQGKTMVIATHRERVLALADRVLVLSHGRIVVDKPREEALAMLAGKKGGGA